MNLEISMILQHISDLLEVRGENPFKINAYRGAAKTIESLATEIEEIYRAGKLESVKGIGKGIASKIKEIITTGKSSYLEELSRSTPTGLLQIMRIPWVGPRKVRLFYEKFGIETVEQLEEACVKKKLRKLPGIGAKTEGNILRGIRALRAQDAVIPWGIADLIATTLFKRLEKHPDVSYVSFSGSMRRARESIDGIEIIVAARDTSSVKDFILGFYDAIEFEPLDDERIRLIFPPSIPVDVTIVQEHLFHLVLWYQTGSSAHCTRIDELAKARGLVSFSDIHDKRYSLYGGFPSSEEEIYHSVGLQYVPPELREDFGEIEAAMENSLPVLIEESDIKGDLHLHTSWSDGGNTLEEMVEAARKMGYEYIAITEHSKSLRVAGGIDEDKLKEQCRFIRKLNEKLDDITILTGIEVDILPDGTLDFPDTILRELDIVIASVHTAFNQDEDTITKRIVSAMESKYVDILAHPTGRLLGRRDGYAVNVSRILEVARDTGTILEINSSPDRLDLGSEYVRKCKEMGIPVVINTDAHSMEQLNLRKFGVAVARKAWLSREDVINTYPLGKIPLHKRKRT